MSQKTRIVVMIEVSKKRINSELKTKSEEWGMQSRSLKTLRSREATVCWPQTEATVKVDARRVQGYSLLFKQNQTEKWLELNSHSIVRKPTRIFKLYRSLVSIAKRVDWYQFTSNFLLWLINTLLYEISWFMINNGMFVRFKYTCSIFTEKITEVRIMGFKNVFRSRVSAANYIVGINYFTTWCEYSKSS